MGEKKGRSRKVSDIDKSNSEYLTVEQFQEQIIPWSIDTIKRRIEGEGLPAIKDTNGFVFNRKEVREWFKRREHQAS